MNNSTENLKKYHYPILVSSSSDTKEDIMARWDKFDSLSWEEQEKVSSKKTALFIKSLENRYNLSEEQTASLSRILRRRLFDKIKTAEMSGPLAGELQIEPAKAREIADLLTKNILQAEFKIETPSSAAFQKTALDINQAIQKFPKIGEQLITNNPIKIKIFPEPIRPSVKNWIIDYHQKMGAGLHEVIERGNYLYHSENCKKLSPGERQKLAVVLKSLDEKEPLTINLDKQEIVFDQVFSAPGPSPAISNVKKEISDYSSASASFLRSAPPSENSILSPQLKLVQKESAQKTSQDSSFKFSFPQKMPVEQSPLHKDQQKEKEGFIREFQTGKESLETESLPLQKNQPSSDNSYPASPALSAEQLKPAAPAVEHGSVKMSADAAQTWKSQTQTGYKPFRIRPFALDDKDYQLPTATEDINDSNVVDLRK